MVFCVLGFNVVVRNIYIMKLLKKFFEFCNIDEYMIIINVGVFFVWVFFFIVKNIKIVEMKLIIFVWIFVFLVVLVISLIFISIIFIMLW